MDEAERDTYLKHSCGSDKELLKEVKSLLNQADSEHLKEPFVDVESSFVFSEDKTSVDHTIGPYRVIKSLGAGGMGQVYLAVRNDEEFERFVALKVIRKGTVSDEILKRFYEERQILASLSHPNIARLFDGGTTKNGMPWFAMEYIEGQPITEYCNQYHLTVEEKINLFLKVCSAVQYAHSNLVIHRDLKPANIIITPEGTPKLLDFGIAKLLDPKLTEQTLLETRPEQKFWTPQYAAPEQVKGEAITTATDVYALGVLLHKLLAGTYPFDFKDKSIKEVERIITEQPPVAMSQCVQGGELKKTLSGDLDAVILKALRKEPLRRFQSIEQLYEDIERFLKGYPVKARPETIVYRANKFVRRNKLIASISLALIFVLTTATILSTNFALEKQQAEARAQAEAEEAKRQTIVANTVNEFLQQLLGQADPMINPEGKNLTLTEAVELAQGLVEDSFTGQPEIESAVRLALGEIDMNLGQLDRSAKQLELALKLATDSYGKEHRHTFLARAQYGLVLNRLGQFDKAERVLKEGLEEARSAPKENWDMASKIDNELGLLYLNQGSGAAAESHLLISAKRDSATYGVEAPKRLTTLHNLTGALWMQGKKEEALKIAKHILEIRRGKYKESHPKLTQSLNLLSFFYVQTNQYEKALPLKREDLKMRQSLYDKDHPDLARGMHNLAHLLNIMDRSKEALPIQEEAVAMWKNTLPTEHPDVQRGHIILSKIYQSLNQYEEAASLIKNYISEFTNIESTENSLTTNLLTEMANARFAAGQFDKAEYSYLQLVSELESTNGINNSEYLSVKSKLGEIKIQQGKLQEAETYILESAEAVINLENVSSDITHQIVQRAIKYCKITNQKEKITFWRNYLENSAKQLAGDE